MKAPKLLAVAAAALLALLSTGLGLAFPAPWERTLGIRALREHLAEQRKVRGRWPPLSSRLGGSPGAAEPRAFTRPTPALTPVSVPSPAQVISRKEVLLLEKDRQLRESLALLRDRESQIQRAGRAALGGSGGGAQPAAEPWWRRAYSLQDAQADLYADSLVLRAYLDAHGGELAAAWRKRLARQRKRGVVVAAGRQRTLGNAFATLRVLRHHHKSRLPFAVM